MEQCNDYEKFGVQELSLTFFYDGMFEVNTYANFTSVKNMYKLGEELARIWGDKCGVPEQQS